MKILKLVILYLCIPVILLGQDKHIYFVVDGSGSMGGVPLQEAKNAMQKMAKHFFINKNKIALVVGEDSCGAGTKISTKFFSSITELDNALKNINTTGTHNITLGFEYAQNEMKLNRYKGHIYMFGDCDGLEYCDSIKKISNKYKKLNALTPFTYLEVAGCTNQEKKAWNKTLKDIGAKTGLAKTFDYKTIISKKINIHKQYFTKFKYLNKDGSLNLGTNFTEDSWRCIKSDGLLWLAITEKEQKLDFFIKQPTGLNFDNTSNNLTVDKFISRLNLDNTCGNADWRLPDNFELSRLTQLGPDFRTEIFPYIKIWAYLSSTGGKFNEFKKGVNLNNGKSYDYKENRPYAAIFVSGNIDKTLFVAPKTLLDRLNVLNQTFIRCTASMVANKKCTQEECIALGECN